MSKIAVLTDSSCDFKPEQAEKAGFSVVPLTVTFEDGTVMRDGIDLTSEEFFERLKSSKTLPKTSQPSPDTFIQYFEKFADYDDIIYIAISSKLSGSINAAANAGRILAEDGFKPRLHIVDSMSASAGSGVLALEAIEMIEKGMEADEIATRLDILAQKLGVYFVLDTLEYLRKGGRIGNISSLVGGMLGIKPMLTTIDGLPINIDKTRGFQQACNKLIDKFLYNAEDIEKVIIVAANAPDRALKMRAMLTHHVATIKCRIIEVGSVMGTYTGPGGIGLMFIEKDIRW